MSELTDKALVKVNGTELPFCSTYKVTWTDTDLESGRNINAVMIRNRVRKDMYKLEFTYNLLDDDSVQLILNAITDVFFTVEFYSPLEKKRITRTMYCGDRSGEWITVRGDNGEYTLKMSGFAFNLIEK